MTKPAINAYDSDIDKEKQQNGDAQSFETVTLFLYLLYLSVSILFKHKQFICLWKHVKKEKIHLNVFLIQKYTYNTLYN